MGIPNHQWTYVIINFENLTVVGTDDEKVAKEFNNSDEHGVLNLKTAQMLGPNHELHNIPEQTLYQL